MDTGKTQIGNLSYACRASDYGNKHVEHITHISDHRHRDIAVCVCRSRTVAELVILFVKLLLGFFLMAKDFYDLLTVNHFFDITVDIAQGLLLFHEESAASVYQGLDYLQ